VNVIKQGTGIEIDRRALLWLDRDNDGQLYVYAQALRRDYPVGLPKRFDIKPRTTPVCARRPTTPSTGCPTNIERHAGLEASKRREQRRADSVELNLEPSLADVGLAR
jgi:hypothetical protein